MLWKHFAFRQAADIARIKHLESKVVELELQLMNPEKDEMAATVRRMELKLDEDHNKMESLKVEALSLPFS